MFWRKPPPEPIYKRKPIATAALIFTMVVTLILGPVGLLWNGMTEEMKSVKGETKDNRGAVFQNQLAIKELLTRQQMMLEPPTKLKVIKSGITRKVEPQKPKSFLTPSQFERYMTMKPEIQAKYKKYLESRGFDTEGL
jgi:hypothetical protein